VPEAVKAELVGGIVYVAAPVSRFHSRPHVRLGGWLQQYSQETLGTESYDNVSHILSPKSEVQPDLCLVVLPGFGGQVLFRGSANVGAPELVVEVAFSTASMDLGAKRKDYEASGVREYYVAVVPGERVVRFVRSGSRLVDKGPDSDGIFRSTVFPGLWLNPVGVFRGSPKPIFKTLITGLASPDHDAFVADLAARRKRFRLEQKKGNGS
jgi:Uma2 family endonuclease